MAKHIKTDGGLISPSSKLCYVFRTLSFSETCDFLWPSAHNVRLASFVLYLTLFRRNMTWRKGKRNLAKEQKISSMISLSCFVCQMRKDLWQNVAVLFEKSRTIGSLQSFTNIFQFKFIVQLLIFLKLDNPSEFKSL